jgi:hypothetical protein
LPCSGSFSRSRLAFFKASSMILMACLLILNLLPRKNTTGVFSHTCAWKV